MDRFVEIKKIQSVMFGPQTFTFRGYKMQHLIDELEFELSHGRYLDT